MQKAIWRFAYATSALAVVTGVAWGFIFQATEAANVMSETEIASLPPQVSVGRGDLVERRERASSKRWAWIKLIEMEGHQYACTPDGLLKNSQCAFDLDTAKYFYRHPVRLTWVQGNEGRILREIAFLDESGQPFKVVAVR